MIQGSFHAANEPTVQEFLILTVGAVTSGKPCSGQQKPASTRRMSSEMGQRCFVEGHFAPNILEKELAKAHRSKPTSQVKAYPTSQGSFLLLCGSPAEMILQF